MIVALEGGMGNQLFQMAFGLSVAKARGEECFFTTHKFSCDPNGRVYELGHFAADVKLTEREEESILWDSWYYNPAVYDKQWKSFAGHWQTEKYFDVPLVRAATTTGSCPSTVHLQMAADIADVIQLALHPRPPHRHLEARGNRISRQAGHRTTTTGD